MKNIQFTPAEKRVIPTLALPVKIAAFELDLSEKTILYHAKKIERRLGVRNRASSVIRLSQMGFHIRTFQ